METGRPIHEFYHFFRDANGRYITAPKSVVTDSPFPYPLDFPPTNFTGMKVSMGTNNTYMSLVRSVSLVFNFINDGADILREFKYNRGGFTAELYYIITRWDSTFGSSGAFRLYYTGRFDFKNAKDNRIKGYSIPCVDTSVWGVLSQNDTVQYQIDCSSQNPKCIPVLLDGITLAAKFTYQPVASRLSIPTPASPSTQWQIIPVVLVASDGDSSGIIAQSPSGGDIAVDAGTGHTGKIINPADPNFIFKTAYNITVNIIGTITFFANSGTLPVGGLQMYFVTNYQSLYFPDQRNFIYKAPFAGQTLPNKDYTIDFNFTYNLQEGEAIYFLCEMLDARSRGMYIEFRVTNFYVSAVTRNQPSITWALRPLDLFQSIVDKATKGQYTVNSNFFTENNKIVCTAGNSIRLAPNAYIKASFQDCFKSYDTEYWLAGRVINNQLWIEPFKIVYDQTTNLFVLGQMIDAEITDAIEYLFNQVEVGSPKQDYRHTSGRLEFNGTNKFAIALFNIKKTLDLKSVFRKDGFGATFIQLDYQQESTQDNSGDDSVFMLDITDEKSTEGVEVENFSNVNVNNEPLSPIIYYPFTNDTIPNSKPTLRGVCQPTTNLNIYVDGTLDGSVVSDANGNWVYDIQTVLTPYVDGVTTGVHTIDATFTDETGTLSSITVFITTDIVPVSINIDESLYNNKPLIKGFAPAGTIINVSIDGNSIGNTTTDGSCRWFIQSPIMSNGTHTISANGVTKSVTVNSFTTVPLITSFEDGFQIVNNLPLVEGVAIAGTKVDLWLNYYADVSLGTTFADNNGNWSIQLVPLFKTGGVDVLTPLPNGLNIISTSLEIKSAIVSITGYLLNRPAYSSIEGVLDQTVFNTRLTPKLNMIARMSFFKSVFFQQPNTIIEFSSGDKNQGFATTLDGVRVKESDNIQLNQYSDVALFLPLILSGKVQTPFFFVDTMNNFASGGLVRAFIEDNEVICLPIGEMNVEDVTNDIQTWKLLISVLTPLSTLLKLSSPGSTFNFNGMQNAIYRSDYNTLHFVSYVPPSDPKYKSLEIYDDLFEYRNDRWTNNPTYIQKVQKTDPCRDQIVTTGVSGTIILNCYNIKTGKLLHSYNYIIAVPAPIPFPDIVQECLIDFSIYDGDIVFIMFVSGIAVAISQPLNVAEEQYGTVLIESTHSKNKTGAFFSTGFTSVFRIEGLLEKPVSSVDDIIVQDDAGNYTNQHSVVIRKRTMLLIFIPDWLYLKVAASLTLDTLKIENVEYVLSKDAKLDPVEKTEGHPLYYYSIDLVYKNNILGSVIGSQQGDLRRSVVLVTDAGAFGMGGGGFINIELKEN